MGMMGQGEKVLSHRAVLGPGRVRRRRWRHSRRAWQGNQVTRDSRESCEHTEGRSERRAENYPHSPSRDAIFGGENICSAGAGWGGIPALTGVSRLAPASILPAIFTVLGHPPCHLSPHGESLLIPLSMMRMERMNQEIWGWPLSTSWRVLGAKGEVSISITSLAWKK